MNGENRPLVTDEPVEVEEKLVKVQDYRKSTHNLEEIIEYTSN